MGTRLEDSDGVIDGEEPRDGFGEAELASEMVVVCGFAIVRTTRFSGVLLMGTRTG